MEIDGFRIAEAMPLEDGSFRTTLIDTDGNNVGTVTRLPDGTSTADVANLETGAGGFDWSNVLGKVTQFLDNVAASARQTSDEATRISRGITGAATGAQAGYNAPIDLKPWIIGAAAVAAALLIGKAMSSSSSRRRR